MADWDTFGLLPEVIGSEVSRRLAVRVTVQNWHRPIDQDDPMLICLTADADTPEELDAYIDELIEELQTLKEMGRRKMAKLTLDQSS